ncbi:hypothetical protein HY449_00130 [Candidatus Pacearchaeota archaeon]|nr:hypothetical protein [Candidatus Pacearchaeota archaeon]
MTKVIGYEFEVFETRVFDVDSTRMGTQRTSKLRRRYDNGQVEEIPTTDMTPPEYGKILLELSGIVMNNRDKISKLYIQLK